MKWEIQNEDTIIERIKKSKFGIIFPQFFLSYKLNKFVLGLGYYVGYQNKNEWEIKEYVWGEYIYQNFRSYLSITSFSPTLSYKANEKIGIGGKIEILYVKYEINDKSEATQLREYGNGWSFTIGAGLLYKLSNIFSLGFNLKGPFKFKSKGKWYYYYIPSLDTIFKYNIQSECNFPMAISIGTGIKSIPNSLVAFEFEYTTWSFLDYFTAYAKTPEGKFKLYQYDFEFKNTFKIKTGFEYSLSTGLHIRTGFTYDKAASPVSSLSLRNIDVDKFVFFWGIGYNIKNFTIDLAFSKGFGEEKEYGNTRYNMNPIVIGISLILNRQEVKTDKK